MTTSVVTPLQLIVAAEFLDNSGLSPLPASLTDSIASFNAQTIMVPLLSALDIAGAATWCSAETLLSLQSIRGSAGPTYCPALGNSIPPAYDILTPVTDPSGFTGQIEQTGNAYLGNGDLGRFAFSFMAVQGFIASTNQVVQSANNANSYLGPTFSNMNALVTNNISSVNTNLTALGQDLAAQGVLVDLNKLNLYGTPAGLLQQIAAVASIQSATLPGVQSILIRFGLSNKNIADLVDNNRISLTNANGLTTNEFDKLQRIAYLGMKQVTGDALLQVTTLLRVTTPGVKTMADLMDPVIMFPKSFTTMQTPSPAGPILIYDDTGAVNSNIEPIVSTSLTTLSGCNELAKIIPPAAAVANKAIQVSLQQISSIAETTLPQLAQVINGYSPWVWDVTVVYPANVVVSAPSGAYRSQQPVPIGIDISETAYWLPANLPSLNTMAELPLIEALAEPIPESVVTVFDQIGLIDNTSVLGTAINFNELEVYIDAVADQITTLDGLGALTALYGIYQRIQRVADGTYGNPTTGPVTVPAGAGAGVYTSAFPYYAGDNALQVLIPLANSAIDTIIAAYPSNITTINGLWNVMANLQASEKSYQDAAGINYFDLPAGTQTDVFAFALNVPSLGLDLTDWGSNQFLQSVVDLTTLGGQAVVGAMREGVNTALLDEANLSSTANQVPADPPITPSPAVTTVN